MSSPDRGRRVITLADCRAAKPPGPAVTVQYVQKLAAHQRRGKGRQPVFVQVGSRTVLVASCGRDRHASAIDQTRKQKAQSRRRMEGPACPGKPPAR